jgi:hypothetical protein
VGSTPAERAIAFSPLSNALVELINKIQSVDQDLDFDLNTQVKIMATQNLP